jgi:hypothetical protein
MKNIDIMFVAGFGPVTTDQSKSKKLYIETLGLPYEEMENGYIHSENVSGVKHFALWPLHLAAKSCFGS